MRPFALPAAFLLVVLSLGAARADDPPAGGGAPPKSAAPAAPTVEDLLRDLGDSKAADKRLDAALAAKSVQDARLLAPLVKAVRDEHPDVRAAAIAALGARTDPDQQKKAADALGGRLGSLRARVEHEAERAKIVAALHDLAQPASVDVLLDGIDDSMPQDEVEARCRAVGNIPSAKAVEGLINLMAKRHRDGSGTRGAAVRGLQYATGERQGNDPDSWRAWWKEHEKTFDFDAAAYRRAKERKEKEDAEDRRDRRKKDRDGKGEGKGKGKKDDGGTD